MNKISIITITYNNLVGLKRTVESIFDQTYTDYECIVIDGGSTDGSVDLLKEYDSKITYWVSEPDKGIYNAMNKGLKFAQGDYVHFLNAGDSYASNEVLSRFFSEKQYIAFIRGIQICDYGDRTEIWTNLGEKQVTVYDMFINTMLHQATFIRRDLFDKYGLYDEDLKITSDWKFFFKAILGGEKTKFENIEIVDFEMLGVSTAGGENGTLLIQERTKVIEEFMPVNCLQDYKKMYENEKDEYIVRFIKSNTFLLSCFKAFRKICLSVGIGK